MCAESLVAAQLRGVMCDVMKIDPLSGVSCFLFYRPSESRDYRWEKEENQRQRRSFKDAGSSFSSVRAPLTWQTVTGTAPRRAHVC